MRKMAGIAILILSVVLGICLSGILSHSKTYEECIIDSEEYDRIISERSEDKGLLKSLIFDGESLFLDQSSNIFYYSIIEGNSGAFNPQVEAFTEQGTINIAFLESELSTEVVKNNQAIGVLAYTQENYCEYRLICTTLPMMNISCMDKIVREFVPMEMTVFDNRQGAVNRVIVSSGEICIRGATTSVFPKKGYRIALTMESLGGNVRSNQISLLGMRQDDDWILYAAYNDQEKIRNVFSSNLWKYTCAEDNEDKVDAGMEYKYLELFVNGEYWGLYALGFPIDAKQLRMSSNTAEQALYKKIAWDSENNMQITEGDVVSGYEVKNANNETGVQPKDWILLWEYYDTLFRNQDNIETLYNGIDIDNAIDFYLFINMIQGVDHAGGNTIKNSYLAITREREGLKALYIPWDMDITWGNGYIGETASNYTIPYGISAEENYFIKSGYLYWLIQNHDAIIEERILEKYWSLRADKWSERYLNELLDEYETDIYDSGAFLRDRERWPEGTYSDPEIGLDDFREYVRDRLQEMDVYYQGLELSAFTSS